MATAQYPDPILSLMYMQLSDGLELLIAASVINARILTFSL